MKNKLHNQLQILNYISSTDRFKVIFIMTVVLSLYGSIILSAGTKNIIDAIYIPFQFEIFNILMFSLILLNTLNTCTVFNEDFSLYIIRLKTKNNYIKEALKNVIILNLFYLLLFFLLYFSILYVYKFGNIQIYSYSYYGISNLSYIIFYLARYVVISILISSISTILYVNFKNKITLALDSLFLVGFMITHASVKENFTLIPWSYFNGTIYDSFMKEVSFTILFLFSLELIIYIAYHLTLKLKKINIS